MHRQSIQGLLTSSAIICAIGAASPTLAQERSFNVPAQSAATAIPELARQADIQILVSEGAARGKRTKAVRGRMRPAEAVRRLIAGTGLRIASSDGHTFTLAGEEGKDEASRPSTDVDKDYAGLSEILVIGSKSQNVDIRRTENDAQPYVVFDSQAIERSGASNLENFFRTRVPQNTRMSANSEGISARSNSGSNISTIDLRGLGADETLILIDGRRAPRLLSAGQAPTQADINGIPLDAIERIEILPSTAGGIYGGGATGGVINIVRKRNYNGVDARIGFDGTFRGGGESFRMELSGGFSPDHGATQISFSASRTAARPLYAGDNDLWRAGRQLFAANDANATLIAGQLVNIRSQTGTALTLDPRFGGGAIGSNRLFLPAGYRGFLLDGIGPLVANAGKYDLGLSNDNVGRFATIRNGPRVTSLNLNIRREVVKGLDLYVDTSWSDNFGRGIIPATTGVTLPAGNGSASDPNPFQQAINLSFPKPGTGQPVENQAKSLSFTGGTIVRLGSDWTATAEYNWSRLISRTSYTTTPLLSMNGAAASGALDIFRDVNAFPVDFTPFINPGPNSFAGPYETRQKILSARASGPLFKLPGGSVALSLLAEHRKESAAESRTATPTFLIVNPARSQAVDSLYGEIRAPIVGSANAFSLFQELELQGAIRYDHYATNVADPLSFILAPTAPVPEADYSRARTSATSYTAAVRWVPVKGIALRGSYSTGFLPPSIAQLTATPNPGPPLAFIDPKRGGEFVGTSAAYSVIGGGSANLQPERSQSASFGVILTPSFLKGLRLSVDYSRIRKTDEIRFAPGTQDLINSEDLFVGRITRSPRSASDPASWSGPITLIDATSGNFAKTKIDAFDFQGRYNFSLGGAGDVAFYAAATLQSHLKLKALPTTAAYETVGYFDGPLRWRANFGMDWNHLGWSAGWNAQYFDSYSLRYGDPLSAASGTRAVMLQGGVETIPSQTYVDLYIGYKFEDDALTLLRGTELSIGIQNVFDKHPPAIADSNVTGYSQYGDPRLRRYSLSLRRHF